MTFWLTCDGDGKIDEIESVEIVDGCIGNELDVACEGYASELDWSVDGTVVFGCVAFCYQKC